MAPICRVFAIIVFLNHFYHLINISLISIIFLNIFHLLYIVSDNSFENKCQIYKLKIAELFCGAGGFAEGAKKAGFKHIWGVDIHKDSCETFKNNQKCEAFHEKIEDFSKPKNLKKVKKDFGKINGLLFGFPCNDFSLVGKNKKMEGKFGGLYTYACKVLNFFEPEFFVAENVTSLSKKLKI